MPPPPWAGLPPSLAGVLRPVLGEIADEIIVAIRREVDDYRRPLTGDFGRNVRLGVEFALGRFLELFGDAEREPTGNRAVYVQLGRGEFRQGRSLDALLSAYRLGARVAWRRFVEAGRAAGVDPDVLFVLGEAMFAYIDELSGESTEGYAAAQSEAAGERARERRRLVRQLLQVPPPAEDVVRAQADRAGWPLPDTLAALLTEGDDADALASRLGTGTIAAAEDGLIVALIPDPEAPGRRTQLFSLMSESSAALGPTVTWAQATTSSDRARLGLRLAAPGELLVTDERLGELVLRADPLLAADLAGTVLAPLNALPAKQAAKLTETLRAWLDHHGRVDAVAAALDVHPQTVRYRVNQLREHVALDDPEQRFELALALRAAET
ncbi:MAG: hypothetical protein QOF76_1062 [Solirubrobacteraceae bacterium]|jgi:hypothetical protein|nr:hypothetical protein [Solirubrobacteraceae bacterium]